MIQFKNKIGYNILKLTTFEREIIGHGNECDMCSSDLRKMEFSYLIGVLNYGVCPSCYIDWEKRALFYKDDLDYETMIIENNIEVAKLNGLTITNTININ